MSSTAIRKTPPLAVASAGTGAVGVIFWLVATHEGDVARLLGGLPLFASIGLFLLIGVVAMVTGILALLAMRRESTLKDGLTHQRLVAVSGILLGVFNMLLAFGGIAVSNFRPLGPGPF